MHVKMSFWQVYTKKIQYTIKIIIKTSNIYQKNEIILSYS